MAKVFYLDNTLITQNKKHSYLTADITAGASSFGVQSIVGFSSTAKVVLIGELGDEHSEFAYLSHATAPASKTIYLYTALTFDHPEDTKVRVVDYDQFAISRSTAVTSQKGTLSTEAIQVDRLQSIYRDIVNSTGYGFVEYKDSIGGTFSPVSDPVPYVGFADNTVFMIKKRAMDELGEEISDIITNEFLDDKLWEARREYHNAPGKRPFRKKYDTDIGNVATGMYRVLAPTDLENPETAENLYGVRIGVERNMSYMDKKELDAEYQGSARTELAVAYAVGDQDLYCDDVRDLDDSGTVEVEGDSIQYSAKCISGGTLRISTDGEDAHAIDKNVWQNMSVGLPDKFTVFQDSGSAYIYFNKPFSTTYVNQNIWADYYRTLVEKDSDADVLDETNFDMFVHFLEYKIKKKKDKGVKPLTDEDFLLWIDMKKTSLQAEYIGDKIRISPAIDHLPIPD